jgi:tetratricopeptide (TPR) repeat protein
VNTLTSLSVTQANEETYDKLLVSLEAGLGMLQIFIAVCDDDRQREEIITNYERELASIAHPDRVYLDSQEPSLRLAISQQVTVRENAIAIVTGTEGLSERGESLEKFFGYLQWTREGLREFKMPIVLWIPARIFAQLAKKAPDFYSWRNGIFQFQPEPSVVTKLSWEQVKQVAGRLIFAHIGEHLKDVELLVLRSFWDGLTYDEMAKIHFLNKGYLRSVGATLLQKLSEVLGEQLTKSNFKNALNRGIESITNDSSSSLFSVEQLESSLAQGIEQWGENSRNLEPLYSQLGSLYATRVQFRESEDREREYALAQDYLHKAIALQTQFKQEESLANSLNNLAKLYYSQEKYNQAEPLYQQVLAINRANLPPNHPSLATSLNNLALLYQSQGKYNQAEPLYQEALAIDRASLPPNHPDLAIDLNNLANLYYSQGKYSEAEPLYQQVLAISRASLPPNHPNLAIYLNNLANLYYSQRKYNEAEPLYQEALAIERANLPPNHPNLAIYLNNLANLHIAKNEMAIAEQEYQEALQIIRELTVENPRSFLPDVAMTLNNLANLHSNKNEMAIAEQEYQEALEIKRNLAEENPRSFLPDFAMTLINISTFYLRDQPEKALALAQEVLEIAQQFPELPTVQQYAETARAVLQAISE